MSKDQGAGLAFTVCVEGSGDSDPRSVGPQCASQAGLDKQAVMGCFDGPDGIAAQTKMAKKTARLGMSRPGTPWVTVNGKPLQDPYKLLSAVCAQLRKSSTKALPAGCSAPPPGPEKLAARRAAHPCLLDEVA